MFLIRRKKIKSLLILLLALLFFSCKNAENDLITTDSVRLNIISGNNQAAEAGNFLLNPIVIKLGLSSGIGLPNKIVNISVIKGGGEINNSTDTTDSDGLIKIQWKMGYEPGKQELRIFFQGLNDLVVEAEALAKPGKMEIISGDDQIAFNGDTLLESITVEVKDSLGNPIKNRVVKGSIISGGGKLIPSENITDAEGKADFKWVVGPETGDQKAIFAAGTSNSVEASASVSKAPPDQDITIFNNTRIDWNQGTQTVTTNAVLPASEYNSIEAVLELKSPCINCGDDDCDPWDRIGFITIDAKTPGGGTIKLELLRFITPFGNSNTYTQDVSQFASLLTGNVKFNAYISTFIGHWNITFKLRYKKATLNNRYFIASPVIFDDAMFSYEEVQALDVDLPENNEVILTYFTTGHNNQGRNCDEFCEKVNEIYVDNKLVESFIPWRTDCEDFADINKCEGAQTLSFDRAGWCPGDVVRPHVFNVGKLSPGKHIFKIRVVGIEDNGGYWRTSLSVIAKK